MENTINLKDYKDTFIISYDGALHSVEANTFANSIVSISRVIEEINYLISPDSKVEIRIEAINKGSFKPTIKVCKKIWGKVTPFLPEKNTTVPLFITLLALLHNNNKDLIVVKDDEVVIETSSSKIIIPREIYDNANKIKEQKNIKSEIASSFQILDNDPSIAGFTIQKELSDNTFPFKTTRDDFSHFTNMCSPVEEDDKNKRKQLEKANLQLIKVILEKGRRKWEFAWKGIKISAPVLDDSFWDKMAKGDVSIKQGDSIDVDLQIMQVLDPYSKVYFNESYEVLEVNNYIPASQQENLF